MPPRKTTSSHAAAEQLRKPLSEFEKSAKPTTVCVTGATGYLAGSIVARLLAAGHVVHGTVRDPSNEQKAAHLWKLPGAKERLKLFKSELTDASSFDEPMRGCTVLIHTASPVIMNPPKGREQELLIQPAVSGVENALTAATRAKTVTRVVMTSSFAAICSDISEHGACAGRPFTENDWNETASASYLPYHASKTRAEQKAFELEKEAKGAWKLATICPPVVQGPPVGNIKTETIGLMRRLLMGANYPWVPPVGMGFVDVDDVAFAHCNAAFSPSARGRYLVSSPEAMFMLDYARLLKPEYGDRKLPFLTCPLWLVWFAVKVLGSTVVDYELLSASAHRLPRLDTSKAARDLGLSEYIPVKKTAIDMADKLCELGIVRGGRSGSGGGSGSGRKDE